MSLSVSGYSQQALVYQMMQPLAVNGNSAAPTQTQSAPTHSASPVASSATSASRGVVVSDMLAVFLSGLVSGGPLPSEPARNPLSPALADSSSAPAAAAPVLAAADLSQVRSELQSQASDPTVTGFSAATSAAPSYGPTAPSDSSTAGLGVVLAAYVSNMPSEPSSADSASGQATHATASASAAVVSHPGSHAEIRDHASQPAAVSSAGQSAAAA